jgi:phospholipid-binding lipoprotein MlaA
MANHRLKTHLALLVLSIVLLITGCAEVEHPSDDDPYESFNRTMFSFNRELDRDILKPLAVFYDTLVPEKLQAHITLFFKNISLLPTIANDVLQADISQALSDTSRFCVNSTLGLLGFFDASTKFGFKLKENQQDIGLTLAKYGAKEAPFVMLPLLGPKTLREVLTLPVSMKLLSPVSYVDNNYISYGSQSVQLLNLRTALLPADKLVDEAFDPYLFVRNAYLQNRNHTIGELTSNAPEQSKANSFDTEEISAEDQAMEEEEDDFLEELEDESFLLSYRNYHRHYHPRKTFHTDKKA